MNHESRTNFWGAIAESYNEGFAAGRASASLDQTERTPSKLIKVKKTTSKKRRGRPPGAKNKIVETPVSF